MEGTRTLLDERWKGKEFCSMENETYKNSVHGIKEKKVNPVIK